MAEQVEYRILANNGAGWYWEVVVTRDREVVARGLAETHAQARVDAEGRRAALAREEQDSTGHQLSPQPRSRCSAFDGHGGFKRTSIFRRWLLVLTALASLPGRRG